MVINHNDATMGEEDRGGLPDLDQKLRSGFFFLSRSRFCIEIGEPEPPQSPDGKVGISQDFYPDLSRLFWPISSKSRDKSWDKSRLIPTLPDF